MWTFLNAINLVRYLCVWRVNRALIRLPHYPAVEFSQTLGTIIAERLPTTEARAWNKALNPLAPTPGTLPHQPTPDPAWPVESTLFVYPGKRMYGPGELIFWEFKLLGPQADHSFLLEVLLPAMEAAGHTKDPRWYKSNGLWGRFDIHAVYAARGAQWQPVVTAGRLDTGYRAQPLQWAKGLTFAADDDRILRRLTWVTPVDLRDVAAGKMDNAADYDDDSSSSPPIPTLPLILDALLRRLAQLLPGKYTTPGDVWNLMSPDEQAALWEAVNQANHAKLRSATADPLSKGQPAGWLGEQQFSAIHPLLYPYLEFASILHIGRQTHLGYGTFGL